MPEEWNTIQPEPPETTLDLELLKKEVGQRFPFYEMKFNRTTAAFFCRIDETALEENFDSLRRALTEKGYIPMLRYEQGEHIIYILQKQKKKERTIWINISLLVATIITTALTGSLLYMNYPDLWRVPNPVDIIKPENLIPGTLLFALPLMTILFVHEMGHYLVSKKHGVAASLPFFIPIPPILPDFNIGTFGALISSRDPMPNRKALLDIGIAGPLAGFLIALFVTAIGIATSSIVPVSQISSGEPILGSSLLFLFLSNVLLTVPPGFSLSLNLVAFAGWIGLLITSINLLPASQLDGGHIFRAVLGEKQKWAGWIAVFLMVFTGWFFFALLIVLMMGMQHPPPLNDATPLDTRRKWLFLVAVIILIICFIPFPISVAP